MTEPSPESACEFPHVCSLEISTDRFAGREPAQRSKCIPFATIDTRLQGSYAASRPSQSGVTTIPTDRVLTLSKHHLLGVKLRLASTKGEVDLFGFNRDELAPPIFFRAHHVECRSRPNIADRKGLSAARALGAQPPCLFRCLAEHKLDDLA